MTPSEKPNDPQIAIRVARLERENRKLRFVGGAVGVLVVASTCIAALRDDVGEVKATRFILVDANGKESAHWATMKPEAEGFGEAYLMFLSSPHRQLRLGLSGGENPSLLMNGGGELLKDGRLGHVKLATDATFGPHLTLWGQNGDHFATEETSVRSTRVTTPWGESSECLSVEVGDSVIYEAP